MNVSFEISEALAHGLSALFVFSLETRHRFHLHFDSTHLSHFTLFAGAKRSILRARRKPQWSRPSSQPLCSLPLTSALPTPVLLLEISKATNPQARPHRSASAAPAARDFGRRRGEMAGLGKAMYAVGFWIRETGQALDRLGCRLQGNYFFHEQSKRRCPTAPPPASNHPPVPVDSPKHFARGAGRLS